MYKDYLKERENAEYIEFPHGFIVLKILPDSVYIQDIYVQPGHRRGKVGSEMLASIEQVALAAGKKSILGSCSPAANGATVSMKSMFASGFELLSCEKDMIYLTKNLSQEKV